MYMPTQCDSSRSTGFAVDEPAIATTQRIFLIWLQQYMTSASSHAPPTPTSNMTREDANSPAESMSMSSFVRRNSRVSRRRRPPPSSLPPSSLPPSSEPPRHSLGASPQNFLPVLYKPINQTYSFLNKTTTNLI